MVANASQSCGRLLAAAAVIFGIAGCAGTGNVDTSVTAASASSTATAPSASTTPAAATTVGDVSGTTLQGQQLTWRATAARWSCVNFWSADCAPVPRRGAGVRGSCRRRTPRRACSSSGSTSATTEAGALSFERQYHVTYPSSVRPRPTRSLLDFPGASAARARRPRSWSTAGPASRPGSTACSDYTHLAAGRTSCARSRRDARRSSSRARRRRSSTRPPGTLLLAIPVAALAGLVSFLSPCVLPLVPGVPVLRHRAVGGRPRRRARGRGSATGRARGGDRGAAASQGGGRRRSRVLLGSLLFVARVLGGVHLVRRVLRLAGGAHLDAALQVASTGSLAWSPSSMGAAFMGWLPGFAARVALPPAAGRSASPERRCWASRSASAGRRAPARRSPSCWVSRATRPPRGPRRAADRRLLRRSRAAVHPRRPGVPAGARGVRGRQAALRPRGARVAACCSSSSASCSSPGNGTTLSIDLRGPLPPATPPGVSPMTEVIVDEDQATPLSTQPEPPVDPVGGGPIARLRSSGGLHQHADGVAAAGLARAGRHPRHGHPADAASTRSRSTRYRRRPPAPRPADGQAVAVRRVRGAVVRGDLHAAVRLAGRLRHPAAPVARPGDARRPPDAPRHLLRLPHPPRWDDRRVARRVRRAGPRHAASRRLARRPPDRGRRRGDGRGRERLPARDRQPRLPRRAAGPARRHRPERPLRLQGHRAGHRGRRLRQRPEPTTCSSRRGCSPTRRWRRSRFTLQSSRRPTSPNGEPTAFNAAIHYKSPPRRPEALRHPGQPPAEHRPARRSSCRPWLRDAPQRDQQRGPRSSTTATRRSCPTTASSPRTAS